MVLDDAIGSTAAVLTREMCPEAKVILVWPADLSPINGDATVDPTQVLRELGPAVERACGQAEAEPESGLVLVADGVGGLDLCGTALKHVIGSGGGTHRVRLHAWGHGLGRWHRDLTDVANHEAQAAAIARVADAAVVGSALVGRIAEHLDATGKAKPGLVEAVLGLVRELADGVHGARR